MANTYWGVDSVAPTHQPVPSATGKASLYDYLVGKGMKPAFFGRYLTGGKTMQLTQVEAQYLTNKGCRVLPVYRGSIVGANGTLAANLAIAAASAINMPAGVTIYTDIEPNEKPSVDYISGWCKTMWASQYAGAGGFYCNNWQFSYFMQAFKTAFAKMDATMRAEIYLWCQYPSMSAVVSTAFSPAPVSFFPNGPNVWQYAINAIKPNANSPGLIDMDTANQEGYDAMWS